MRTAALQPVTGRARMKAALPWLLATIALAGWGWTRLTPIAQPAEVLRLGLELPKNAPWQDQTGPTMDLSRDGMLLVYSGRDSSGNRLFLRRLDRMEPTPLPGTEGGIEPVFSPDSRWIAFWKTPSYYRVSVTGGTAELICSSKNATGGLTWIDNRTIATASLAGVNTCSVSGAGSPLIAPLDSTTMLVWPHALPGSKNLLVAIRGQAEYKLAAYDGAARKVIPLDILGSSPHYVEPGYLVYATLDGMLRALPFDAKRLKVTGEPVALMQGGRVGSGGAAKIAVSLNGTIVSASGQSGDRVLELMDRRGTGTRLPVPPGSYNFPRFSPDGRQIAVVIGDIPFDIWLYDLRQTTMTRLTFDGSGNRPTWTLDGTHIIYSRIAGAAANLRTIRADGSAPSESLLTVPGTQFFQAVPTQNGRRLIVRSSRPTGRDIWLVQLDSVRALHPLLTSPADESGVTLSPDGKWMAYTSTESGRSEIYVRSFPDMGARYQVSLEGGNEGLWSQRGDEIYYRYAGHMMLATVRTTPRFEILGRRELFTDADLSVSGLEPMYDLSPDGQRMVVVRTLSRSGILTVTLNLFANLAGGRLDAESGMKQ